jgi:hypothetical protein
MANAQHTRTAHGTSDEVNLEFDAHRSGADEAHHPPILVLSRDPNLVETVKKAAPRGTSVAPAPDLDHVAGKLSDLKPGVLVADTASTADVAAMVAQLTQHFVEIHSPHPRPLPATRKCAWVGGEKIRHSITISPTMPSSACVLPSLPLMSQRRSLTRPAATGTSHHSAACPG